MYCKENAVEVSEIIYIDKLKSKVPTIVLDILARIEQENCLNRQNFDKTLLEWISLYFAS